MIAKFLKSTSTVLATGALLVAPFVIGGSVSANADYVITVPIETIVTGTKGTTHKLATKNVDAKYRGSQCNVNAVAKNQGSVNPGNDLTIISGTSTVVLEDVEREDNVLTEAEGTLTLGTDVVVSLTMGKNHVFSGGLDVNVSCVEPTIEVCRDGSVVPIKQSDRKDSDTDAPCPVPNINVCRDGKVIVIKETDREPTDTTAPCPVHIDVCRNDKVVRILEEDKQPTDTTAPCVVSINVCRDGKVVAINEDDRKDSDTDAPCEVLAATTKTLPNTGPGTVAAGIASATFLGSTVAAQIRMRKRS